MSQEGYEVVSEITSFRDVTALMKDESAGNLLLVGTGGWHGSKRTLADADRIIRGDDTTWLPSGAYITVFVLNPEKVSINWGEIHVKTLNEVEWLREKVTASLDFLNAWQKASTIFA